MNSEAEPWTATFPDRDENFLIVVPSDLVFQYKQEERAQGRAWVPVRKYEGVFHVRGCSRVRAKELRLGKVRYMRASAISAGELRELGARRCPQCRPNLRQYGGPYLDH